jgi:DNA-binding MarR family transcriptional regulator
MPIIHYQLVDINYSGSTWAGCLHSGAADEESARWQYAKALQARHYTVAARVALRQLYDHPDIASSALAELLGMTRGAITKVLDELEAKGLLVRVTRPEDRRSQRLTLIPQGRHILPELAALADQNDTRYFACLDAREQAQLKSLLHKLAQVHQ